MARKNARTILTEALDLLAKGKKWCRGTRLDDDGSMCALGAIHGAISGNPASYAPDRGRPFKALASAIRETGVQKDDFGRKGDEWIIAYGNNTARSFKTVERYFKRAIELVS